MQITKTLTANRQEQHAGPANHRGTVETLETWWSNSEHHAGLHSGPAGVPYLWLNVGGLGHPVPAGGPCQGNW